MVCEREPGLPVEPWHQLDPAPERHKEPGGCSPSRDGKERDWLQGKTRQIVPKGGRSRECDGRSGGETRAGGCEKASSRGVIEG